MQLWKRILSLILALTLIVCMFPAITGVVSADNSGSFGSNLTWTYSEGTRTLCISGTGAIPDMLEYDEDGFTIRPWGRDISESVRHLIIDDGITAIGEQTFILCDCLTDVSIPDSVISIGFGAFSGCTELRSVFIPGSVTEMGEDAFATCPSMTQVIFGDGLPMIGRSAFRGCDGLTAVTIPDSVTKIEEFAFVSCGRLQTVSIGRNVSVIGNGAFSRCKNLTRITVASDNPYFLGTPDGVLFNRDQTKLVQCPGGYSDTYSIPASVSVISKYAFSGCKKLTSVELPEGLTEIGESAFFECSKLERIVIPDSVTKVERDAFRSCTALTLATVGEGVVKLPFEAFYKCTKLEEILLPAGLTTIEQSAFRDCGALTDVYYGGQEADWAQVAVGSSNTALNTARIHWGVASIEGHWTVFDTAPTCTEPGCSGRTCPCGCGSVEELPALGHDFVNGVCTRCGAREDGSGGPFGDGLYWSYDPDTQTLTISGTGDIPQASTLDELRPWGSEISEQMRHVVIENGVSSIAAGMFRECVSLVSVSIPDSVTQIGTFAFYNCESLLSVVIPDSVTEIGGYAFYYCSSMTELTIGEGLTSLNNGVFCRCGSLTSVVIPETVSSIGDETFASCAELTDLTIGSNVASIGRDAFYGCDSLAAVEIPASVTGIGENAFLKCESLLSITVAPENPSYSSDARGVLFNKDKTTLIQYPGGLYGCYTVPDTTTTIGLLAFGYCRSLIGVTIPDSVTTLKSGVFDSCKCLEAVVIPDSVTSIGSGLFDKCESLTSVSFGQGITCMEGSLFDRCGALREVYLPAGLTEIYPYVFFDCEALSDIYFGGSSAEWFTLIFNQGELSFPYHNTVQIHYHVGSIEGHWTLVEELTPATCTERGVGVMSCPCGCSRERDIPKLPHTYQDGVCVVCGSIENGAERFGEGLYWLYDNPTRTLTIYGTGDMPDMEGVDPYPYGDYYVRTPWGRAASEQVRRVVIDEGVTSIGAMAFWGCASLTDVTIPDSVAAIGAAAFERCAELTSIAIPRDTASIGEGAFSECESLLEILVDPDNPCFRNDEFGVLYNKDETELVSYPAGRSGSYTISDSVTAIRNYALIFCYQLTGIYIPAGIRSIGDAAFDDCRALKDVYFGGDAAAWAEVSIGWGNYNLKRADRFHYDTASIEGHWTDAETAPTCLQPGYSGRTCPCGYELGETLPALGHDFAEGSCTRCGMPERASDAYNDVPANAWYADAVSWAMQNGITTGTSATSFSPNQTCTREQVMTFLWRAKGSPEPAVSEAAFTDVKPGSYYYDAVLWAVGEEITSGVGGNRFGVGQACTRAQVMAFLWLASGSPEPQSADCPFDDVDENAYYYRAVLWAVENGVTSGTAPTAFGPNANCTRAQIVTFLYKAFGSEA